MLKRLLVMVLFVAVLALPASAVFAQGGVLKVGATVNGALEESQVAYEVNLEAGTMVEVKLISDDFDPFLEILDGDGVMLAEDDDSAGNYNAMVLFTAPATGTYTIIVRSWSGDSSGAYTLSVLPLTLTQLVAGSVEPVTLTGAEEEQVLLAFDATAGEAYHIYTDDPDIDVRLTLKDPSGAEIAYDDDSGEGYAAYIRSALIQTDGTYVIVLEPYSSESGTVNVALEVATLLSLNDGPQTATIGDGALPMERFVYDFTPGRYRLNVSSNGVVASAFVNVEMAMYDYISLDFTDALEASMLFEISESGMLPVLIDSYSWGDDVTYTVSIESAG